MRYEHNYKTDNSNKKKDFPHGGMVVDEDFGPGEHSSSSQAFLSDRQVRGTRSCLKRNAERESRRQSQNKSNADTLCEVLSNTSASSL